MSPQRNQISKWLLLMTWFTSLQRAREGSCLSNLSPRSLLNSCLGKNKTKLEDLCKVHLTSKTDKGESFLGCLYLGSAQGEFFFVTWMCHFNLINSRRGKTGIEKCLKPCTALHLVLAQWVLKRKAVLFWVLSSQFCSAEQTRIECLLYIRCRARC